MNREHPPKHLILFLAANPASTPRLALDEECSAIENELRLGSDRDAFEFRSKWAVNVHEMMLHLNQLQPMVIHFSGHGGESSETQSPRAPQSLPRRDVNMSPEAGIRLHGETQEHHTVGAHALAEMIRTAAPSVKLVVLNACFSDAVAAAFERVVDCVVGMRGSIGDVAARTFSIGFYCALGHGRSIGNAVAQANAQLAALQLPASAPAVCRTRRGIDADRVVLPSHSTPQPQARDPSSSEDGNGRSFSPARKVLGAAMGSSKSMTHDEIFAASLIHYSTVARATQEIREVVFDRLIQWIDHHRFHTFVPDDDWRTKLPRYAPESELYVSIAVRGRFENDRCKLEIGLWWQRDHDSKVHIYAGFHDVAWGKKVKPKNSHTRRDVSSTAYLLRDGTLADPDSLLEELEAAARIARST
jgi:hypothetical protein